jgi:hypothetical protein
MASQGEPRHVCSHGGGGAALTLLGVEGAVGVHEQREATTKVGTSTGEHLVGRVPAMGDETAYPSP